MHQDTHVADFVLFSLPESGSTTMMPEVASCSAAELSPLEERVSCLYKSIVWYKRLDELQENHGIASESDRCLARDTLAVKHLGRTNVTLSGII